MPSALYCTIIYKSYYIIFIKECKNFFSINSKLISYRKMSVFILYKQYCIFSQLKENCNYWILVKTINVGNSNSPGKNKCQLPEKYTFTRISRIFGRKFWLIAWKMCPGGWAAARRRKQFPLKFRFPLR